MRNFLVDVFSTHFFPLHFVPVTNISGKEKINQVVLRMIFIFIFLLFSFIHSLSSESQSVFFVLSLSLLKSEFGKRFSITFQLNAHTKSHLTQQQHMFFFFLFNRYKFTQIYSPKA